MTDMETMAKEADVIICGYAVSRCPFGFRVINLHDPGSCSVFREDGCLIETNMNDVELSVAREYFQKAMIMMNAYNGNALYGKKWAACGDSFTAGVTGTLIKEGRFKGQNIAYPYLIAERNNMELLSFFLGGRCIAYPADGTFHNSLTDPQADCYYRNIPEDVDYITIYLGINDSHHEHGKGGDGEDPTGIIPLGTIDDQTTATYYGAYNEVLSWLLVNRPFAHIGIMVSNGCDRPAYRTAQIEVATKFGVPYIDMNGDRFTPVMIRSMNPDISEEVKQAVKLKQAVDYPTNTHPNDRAHEFESWFIEDFLRRI